MNKIILVLLFVTSSTFAVDFSNPQKMAEHYQREIQEREDRNREKFEDLERRSKESKREYEYQQMQRQYEIDRMIDETNRNIFESEMRSKLNNK
jgi:hypothetical protein